MKILRMTTALVAGLSILQPTVIEAQSSMGSACIAAQIAAGKSAKQARQICGGGGGGGGDTAMKPPKQQQPKPPKQQQPPARAIPAIPANPGLSPAQPAKPPKLQQLQPQLVQPKPAKPQQPKPAKPQASQGNGVGLQNQNRLPVPGQQPRPQGQQGTPVPTAPTWQTPPHSSLQGLQQSPDSRKPKPANPQPGLQPPTGQLPGNPPPVQPKPAKPQPGNQLPGTPPIPGQVRPGLQQPQPERLPPNLRDALDAQQGGRRQPGLQGLVPVQPPRNEALSAGIDPKARPRDGVRVERQVFTRDNTRRAGQDFYTNLYGQPRARKKDHGLSDLEKLAILGIGAMAVGALLSNGSRVAANSGDRVVVRNPDGTYSVIKDDDVLMRQPGTSMSSESYPDGSLRTVATKPDGTQIVTLYDPMRRIVKRVRIDPDGRQYVLIDDSRDLEPVDYATLPSPTGYYSSSNNEAALREALAAQNPANRAFSLAQIRQIEQVRALAPAVTVQNVTFPSGSAAIGPDQAPALAELGRTMQDMIAANPEEVFLVEGHTDAVGDPAYNLTLSDRRAESLALALTEYYGVPSENMVVQGYGEEELLVPTYGSEPANRRTVVRRITGLLDVPQN